jgi:hypothetical protein
VASFHGKQPFLLVSQARYGSFYLLEELPQLVLLKAMLKLQIDHAEEDGSVVFQDGSSIKADVIMHCTGYRNFQGPLNPFLILQM